LQAAHYRWGVVPLFLLVGLAACERSDPELRPAQVLQDSLNLGDGDRVHSVRLSRVDQRESPEPASVEVREGDYVEFVSADRGVHAVSFTLDSLSAAAAQFLRVSGQEGSPPLVVPGARFVVLFAGAPPGRYPFVVVGNGTEALGAVVVIDPMR
jgi:plastocyanin